ncbi:STAS-like domain-containing protein [Candidatus Microgenomates bacterium]|nr:STAS-like domain-containing protein [Candidatus Microgenomates bacterium]
MKIELKKFGNILTSRQDGREALAALNPQLQSLSENEKIEINFEGVITFTPSWSDEFITKLVERFGDRVILNKTNNPSVKATLDLLKRLN